MLVTHLTCSVSIAARGSSMVDVHKELSRHNSGGVYIVWTGRITSANNRDSCCTKTRFSPAAYTDMSPGDIVNKELH